MLTLSAASTTLSRPRNIQLSWRTFKISRSSRTICTLPRIPILEAIASHDPRSTAVVQPSAGQRFTYGELLRDVALAKDRLNMSAKGGSLNGKAVCFMMGRSYNYVGAQRSVYFFNPIQALIMRGNLVTLLSILANQSIAVPLSATFPVTELRYLLHKCQASIFLCEEGLAPKGLDTVSVESFIEKSEGSPVVNDVKWDDATKIEGGLMLFTSGTTSRPKGVLLPQSALTAQCQSLIHAWKYTRDDYLLHILPLHHIHGILNALLAPLFSGSSVEFMSTFNSTAVWERLATSYLPTAKRKTSYKERVTFLTAVPTMYSHLLSRYQELPPAIRSAAKEALSPKNLRLNISGSAALPTPLKSSWTKLSCGNVLLERYGMTEVGMALSCGLDFKDRVDGSVGWPLPFVEVRLVDIDTGEVIEPGHEIDRNGGEREGEIQLRGPTIFRGYWHSPEPSDEAFVQAVDGKGKWFKTGDIAIRKLVAGTGESEQEWAKGPMYFIKGRKSVDIIKIGGEKVSALEVERELLSLPQFLEAAVVGLPSETFGQIIAAVVVLNPSYIHQAGYAKTRNEIRTLLKEKLARHQIPQKIKVVTDSLPKNSMGKVNKKTLIELFFPAQI
ncbi:MAG: hypothetical protein M1840_004733 [Geoglossum simile]|nr:MAG: hypothetical protein M1840_004733 [Geoglossum simile]